MIVVTARSTNLSAFCFRASSLASSLLEPYGHGVSGWPSTDAYTPPCMSLHWSGVIHTKFGTCPEFMSGANWVYGLTWARRAGLLRMSVNSTNGLCLLAYSAALLGP